MLCLLRFLSVTAGALILSAVPGGHFAFIAAAHAQAPTTFIASTAPPLLPAYSQPALPDPGYIWAPGYWGWNGAGYYWVPGYWALPPSADLLWTPGYWAWNDRDRDYVFHSGYWAPTVGYYGGINYGFGYTGEGYHGGFWRNHQFVYNRAVDDLGTAHVASYANQAFAPASHVSYNGGRGGTTARPTQAQLATARQQQIGPTPVQIQHQQTASRIRNQSYSENKGAPPISAVARANDFTGVNTWLPWPHSIAGAPKPPHGPAIRNPLSEGGRSHGPTAATGAVKNFAQHPATIRGP
ncbi:MAG TPA: YXWGXW repeat-containing protein [Roseiarcus sp.]|nr:YXWGXW repeat-containing protein [Roseiarcus sp.]